MYETTVTSGALLSNIFIFLKIVFFVRLIPNLNLDTAPKCSPQTETKILDRLATN